MRFRYCTVDAGSVHKLTAHRGRAGLGPVILNTLRTGDADLRFYVTTVQDG